MEWVETTGKTIEEAKERALDRLGVDDAEAEFEIIEDAKSGLFGRVRREARVRARVKPTRPRPKLDRKERRRKGPGGGGRGSGRPEGRQAGASRGSQKNDRPGKARGAGQGPGGGSRSDGGRAAGRADGPEGDPNEVDGQGADAPSQGRVRNHGRPKSPGPRPKSEDQVQDPPAPDDGGTTVAASVSPREQAELMSEFLEGLLTEFGAAGEVSIVDVDEDTSEVLVDGSDLGLLIGPKGQTLAAVQDLARTVAQRRAPGPHEGRVRVDVGGYRKRRREALERFAVSVADQVLESGTARALEPMSAVDRKIVHDTVNDIEGVSTTSEGMEPRRRVVISPAP